jgi:hypothetical protein
MKKLLSAVLACSLVLTIAGCKKEEEKAQLPPGHPSAEGGMQQQSGMPDMPRVDRSVTVPNEVKAKWKSVKLAIEDRTSKSVKEYTVAVGSDLAVPNTKVTVKVLAFLPDFLMNEKDITSASDKPNNPAAQVAVREQGREVWKGWLYSMHPGVHPFQHEKIALTLVGGVEKQL